MATPARAEEPDYSPELFEEMLRHQPPGSSLSEWLVDFGLCLDSFKEGLELAEWIKYQVNLESSHGIVWYSVQVSLLWYHTISGVVVVLT